MGVCVCLYIVCYRMVIMAMLCSDVSSLICGKGFMSADIHKQKRGLCDRKALRTLNNILSTEPRPQCECTALIYRPHDNHK